MRKISAHDSLFAAKSHEISTADLNPVKAILKQMIPTGNSIGIDELSKSDYLQEYNWKLVEKAIIELVDEEILDVSEGSSSKKIAGYIGRVIRR